MDSDSYIARLRAHIGHQPLFIPGTRLFLENADGKLLMQLRADFRVWGFPGGNAEIGERFEDCIAREVREETGLEVTNLVPAALSCDPREETLTYPNGDECQFLVMMYWSRDFTGEPALADDENLDIGWFGPGDWPQMLPTMRRGLDAYLAFRRTGVFQVI